MTSKVNYLRRLAHAGISKGNHQWRTAMLNKTSSLFLLLMTMGGAMYTSPASAVEPYSSRVPGEVRLHYYRSGWVNVSAGNRAATLSWSCPKGAPTGGGYETRDIPNNFAKIRVFKSYPSSNDQWRIVLANEDTVARDVRIWAICAE